MITRYRIEEIESELYHLRKREKGNLKLAKKHLKVLLKRLVKVTDTHKYGENIFYFNNNRLILEISSRNPISYFDLETFKYLENQLGLGYTLTSYTLLQSIKKYLKLKNIESVHSHDKDFQIDIEKHFQSKNLNFLEEIKLKN